ncbi:MAG: SDR family oxidoreductase, partial [Nitrospinaceae bacterium]|nr:SDR family oxidoreductase [Nitrospinaceae bacterium]
EVDEVIEAILFLVTPRSSYMTGQTIVIDGGITIV